jgi:hypothetical protein
MRTKAGGTACNQAAGKGGSGADRKPGFLSNAHREDASALSVLFHAGGQGAPAILGDPVGRGWASSRPVKTFEDAVIFVLDVETCLNPLGSLDRQLLCRIVIQEYTQTETATLAMEGKREQDVSLFWRHSFYFSWLR